ncbi:MAG: transglycosylase domain-containing protein, partial [Candidatus Omnitrophica bacterium]|nr:transglycosylase domain-containing protein [Candidatus Omnitrophota bacterium]
MVTEKRHGTLWYFFSYVYVGALLTFAAVVFFCIGYGWPFLMDHIEGLPGIEQVNDYNPNIGSKLLDRNGEEIAEFFREKSGLARYDELPKHLINALIATEDQQFYKHNGVNPIRIAMAAYNNVTSGRIEGGGSTITQQIAKDLYTNWEKSYQRKIKEALYALKIEQVLSKQEILTIYLNQVMYGHNTRGIRAAAEFYFGKEPIDLDLAESATLIGVLKGNTIYSPLANYERSKARRGVVLDSMVDCGFITEEEAKEAKKEDLKLRPKKTSGASQLDRFPYWTHFVRNELLLGDVPPGHFPLTADQMQLDDDSILYGGGLEIRTTLDSQMQEWGTEAVQKALIEEEKVRRKQKPGWGLASSDKPSFDKKIFANATLLGKVTGVAEPNWLTVELDEVPGSPEIAVPYPSEDDWRVQFGVLTKDYYVPVVAKERIVDGSGQTRVPEQDLINRGLISDQGFRFVLQDSHQDQHAQGSLVCLEVGTGRILTWVGGYDWHEEAAGYQRIRCREGTQPGSSLKPVIYSLAFENGYTPTTMVSNEAFSKVDATGKVWSPTNYYADEFGGQVKIRSAIIQSLNIPTVRVFETLFGRAYSPDPYWGKPTLEIARRMGIRTPITKDMGLSVALGTPDISPLEMATAYSVFANQGTLVRPYAIESIYNSREGTRLKHIPSGDTQALDPTIAFQMTSILTGVLRERQGTGYRHMEGFPYPVAGKTGTTNRYFDAWFVGYSNN